MARNRLTKGEEEYIRRGRHFGDLAWIIPALLEEIDALRDESLSWKMTSKVGWGGAEEMQRQLDLATEALRLISMRKEGFADDNYQCIEIADDALNAIKQKEPSTTFTAVNQSTKENENGK